ncbi:ADP-ribosylation factor GTPase-activating protein GCS1 [Fulvia fulva]|uniref:ADP-ribosylation factor GTPase-activating protein GCS1 n=1 Tax=Passalora fulva TaxID=5499 RepID=A0A9Q8LHL5_PASFU|nr:ADP-ribosylation factor GTPase-activating protein GCS1 [Fulvia fulva]KAK4624767.1 ADP-ribosylation factor GTPase-activating protein GCS1 [Fulvia fulva]KAK4625604.1 ADP-ribosylation factor GTPase-activating protein GCS1 [Fulvia fulva]UJO17530.1 ADP-ribosylation factor GTPase-activating protein GCS1 [Fulvia fulva]WPV15520.1 ADP-ribosylation factor GTPase-activating protein GCS1 [Fulvia fulva]WPV30499.1 ADP-ribosylation factor GTPase-activating protein GCS1 [Fulvia fulva]
MSKLWEVDPQTKAKLLEISKVNENNRCVDCGAPSPQWASPKFGIFFCLACSGIHRSLGVHISFVRSVTMDAFKTGEVKKMELGGNKPWKDFFNAHSSNSLAGRDFESCTISERYDSDAGEEWKDRLTAKVEGTEYVPGSSAKAAPKKATAESVANTPAGSGRNTPLSNVRSVPQRAATPSQKAQNEAYFARMGAENENRPDNLAPNQGGKYGGFGSSPMPTNNNSGSAPALDDFQKDPVAALTKGFGWLSSTVSKQAANVNKAYIQPGMQNIQSGDLAAQARAAAMQFGTVAQQGVKGVGDRFNKFVDPEHQPGTAGQRRAAPEKADFWDSFGQDPNGPPKEKKDFWDDFAAAGETATQQKAKSSNLGTSAMKTSSSAGAGAAGKKDEGGWGDW